VYQPVMMKPEIPSSPIDLDGLGRTAVYISESEMKAKDQKP
jgi:hypothetical protein